MPKMTPEERAELEARLRDDDDDDDDEEVEVGRPDGSYFRGSTRAARRHGYLPEKPDPKTGGKPAAKGGAGQGEQGKRFTGRRVS